jgi:DNA-binding PadR family transcriptional regulator
MTEQGFADGDWMSTRELGAVTDYLRTRRSGSTVLDITSGTDLSAVVVVPALNQLMADGIVRRRMIESNGSGPRSAFTLTSAGRRQRCRVQPEVQAAQAMFFPGDADGVRENEPPP